MLIRLSARIEGAAKGDESPSPEEEIYYPALDDGSGLSESHIPAETKAVLDRQATLFKVLGLDDEEPQSQTQTNNRPPTSNNPYAPLQVHGLDGDAQPKPAHVIAASTPVLHTMMPVGGSPFWIRYGNKLRVNGTVEEVCDIK